MDLDPKIKRLCDEKLKTLFCDKFWKKKLIEKEKIGNTDHLFSEADARLAFICQSGTIRNGQLVDELYSEAIKICCPHLEIIKIGKFEFKISPEAVNIAATSQSDKNILENDLPYGRAVKIKGKDKTSQIDLMTYDRKEKILSAYEIKRGGSQHDSGKQAKIIETFLAVRFLLKSFGEKVKNLEVKKARTYIISDMNKNLMPPEYRNFQIFGKEINNHFKSRNLRQNIDLANEYFTKEFKKGFLPIKKSAFKDLSN